MSVIASTLYSALLDAAPKTAAIIAAVSIARSCFPPLYTAAHLSPADRLTMSRHLLAVIGLVMVLGMVPDFSYGRDPERQEVPSVTPDPIQQVENTLLHLDDVPAAHTDVVPESIALSRLDLVDPSVPFFFARRRRSCESERRGSARNVPHGRDADASPTSNGHSAIVWPGQTRDRSTLSSSNPDERAMPKKSKRPAAKDVARPSLPKSGFGRSWLRKCGLWNGLAKAGCGFRNFSGFARIRRALTFDESPDDGYARTIPVPALRDRLC